MHSTTVAQMGIVQSSAVGHPSHLPGIADAAAQHGLHNHAQQHDHYESEGSTHYPSDTL